MSRIPEVRLQNLKEPFSKLISSHSDPCHHKIFFFALGPRGAARPRDIFHHSLLEEFLAKETSAVLLGLFKKPEDPETQESALMFRRLVRHCFSNWKPGADLGPLLKGCEILKDQRGHLIDWQILEAVA